MTTTVLDKQQIKSEPAATPAGNQPLIRLRDVVKIYSTGAGGFTALNGINLDIFQGEFLGLTGKSGAGKTTLLNMISGVSSLTSGEVLFTNHQNGTGKNGYDNLIVHSMNENELALWRGRNLGIVYQSFELLPQMDLVNNIMIPQDFTGSFRPKISRDNALELLDLVELSEHANKKPSQISGGQKQRVAIARALVNDPPVILADEPTGNLDTVTAETIFQIFEQLVANGKTIVMVSHDASLATRFSRWVQISDGEIVETSTPKKADGTLSQSYPPNVIKTAANGGNGKSPVKVDEKKLFADDQQGEKAEKPGRLEENGSTVNVSVSEPETLAKGKSGSQQSAADSGPAVVLRDVIKTYRNAAGEFPALKGINLQMNYGQFISIVGKSGSGKSTLLNMLTGIDHPTSGEVIIGGKRIYEMTESQRALWRGKNVGIVFQFFQLLPTLTLLENTMLPMDYCNIYPAQERQAKAMELLNMVGLEDHAFKLPGAVSSGQQQSAAIARALATDPPIIVADEPTGNLDSRSADIILSLFKELAARGKTILLVTHDPSFTKRTQQTVILSDGEIIDDTVARALPLLDHPQMLDATHRAKTRRYEPGTTIIRQGELVENFFMVRSGEVDIMLTSDGCPEMCLARLGPGQFFGEVELTNGVNSVASARAAASGPVELALLDKEDFVDLLNSSAPTERAMTDVAQVRLRENRARDKDCAEL
jgi:ABC-type lipoprotein export system ATPase subunit